MPSSIYRPSAPRPGRLRRLPVPVLALALAGLGACSGDDHRDKYYGMDVGTTFDTSTPPETAPAADVGDATQGDAGDAGEAGETGATDGGASDASDAGPDSEAAEVAPDTNPADGSDAATD